MLAVEVSEIGATLTALSVPGIKPIFDKFVLNKTVQIDTDNSYHQRSGTSRLSKGTALSTLKLRSQHSMLGSRENTAFGNEVHAGTNYDNNGQVGKDGIFVRVDFNIQEEGHLHPQHQPGSKYAEY
jgi:hypothetical protein